MCSPTHPDERATLPFADHVLLWTMRAWVIGVQKRISTAEQLQTAFNKVGAAGAARYLDRFMSALGDGATRQIRIDCVCHPSVSEDERLLLSVLALHQHNRSFEAVALLRTMMDAEGAIRAGEEAGALARGLHISGLMLTAPAPTTTTSRFAFFDQALQGLSANATLH